MSWVQARMQFAIVIRATSLSFIRLLYQMDWIMVLVYQTWYIDFYYFSLFWLSLVYVLYALRMFLLLKKKYWSYQLCCRVCANMLEWYEHVWFSRPFQNYPIVINFQNYYTSFKIWFRDGRNMRMLSIIHIIKQGQCSLNKWLKNTHFFPNESISRS